MTQRRKMWATERVWREPSAGQELLKSDGRDPDVWHTPVLVLSETQYEADLREAFEAGESCGDRPCIGNQTFEQWFKGRKV